MQPQGIGPNEKCVLLCIQHRNVWMTTLVVDILTMEKGATLQGQNVEKFGAARWNVGKQAVHSLDKALRRLKLSDSSTNT